MERERKGRERAHECNSADRKGHDKQRNSEKESNKRRRSRSNSPRRKERCARDDLGRDRPRDHSPMSRGYDHSRDIPRDRQRDHYRGRDINHPRHRGPREHRDQPSLRDESRSEERRRRADYRDQQRGEQVLSHQDRRQREGSSPDGRANSFRHRKRRRDDRDEEDINQYEFGGATNKEASNTEEEGGDVKDKDKPNYGLSGKLTAETNTYRGVVIKYNEPEEARIPKTRWRFYGFKGDETLPTLYMHRQSAYLIGRNRKVVDMPVDHPSCSGQHAVLQYRLVEYEKADGTTGKKVKPYIIDLESTNGTYVNNNRIDAARYYELKEGDMVKFGFSSREYVLLHENSQNEDSQNEDSQNVDSQNEDSQNEAGASEQKPDEESV